MTTAKLLPPWAPVGVPHPDSDEPIESGFRVGVGVGVRVGVEVAVRVGVGVGVRARVRVGVG